jgi:hypothetical protein
MSNKSNKSFVKQSRSDPADCVNFRADVGTTTTSTTTTTTIASQVACTEEEEVSGGLSERLEYRFAEMDDEKNLLDESLDLRVAKFVKENGIMNIGYKKKAGHGRFTISADEKRAIDCGMLFNCVITIDGFSVDNGPLGGMFVSPKGDKAVQKFMLALLKDVGAYYNSHVANVSHSNDGLVEIQSDLDKELEQLFKGVPIDSPLGDKINSLLGAAGEVGDSDTKDLIKFKKKLRTI